MTPDEALELLRATIEEHADELHDEDCDQTTKCDCTAAVAIDDAFGILRTQLDQAVTSGASSPEHGAALYARLWGDDLP